jgi:hypothetical protein
LGTRYPGLQPGLSHGGPSARVRAIDAESAEVLSNTRAVGVEELDQEKLTPLLLLRYGAIQDALTDLGQPMVINQMFTGFQKFLYVRAA